MYLSVSGETLVRQFLTAATEDRRSVRSLGYPLRGLGVSALNLVWPCLAVGPSRAAAVKYSRSRVHPAKLPGPTKRLLDIFIFNSTHKPRFSTVVHPQSSAQLRHHFRLSNTFAPDIFLVSVEQYQPVRHQQSSSFPARSAVNWCQHYFRPPRPYLPHCIFLRQ